MSLVTTFQLFARSGNGLVCIGLRREGDEGDVGDLVDGFAADVGDLFAIAYRYEEVGSRNLEKTWSDVSALYSAVA